jgi:hypothetical protein
MKIHRSSILCLVCAMVYALVVALLSACSQPHFPLKLTHISVSPEPVVGRVVTLTVEVMSTRDEADTTIWVYLPKGVKLEKGELSWHGSLVASHPQTHTLDICVQYAGDWKLEVGASSQLSPNSSYGDADTLHIISSGETAQVIPGSQYKPRNSSSDGPATSPPPTPPPACP